MDRFSTGEKYRRKVIGIRPAWNIYRINGCMSRILSGLDYHNLDVKITVMGNGNTLRHVKRRCRMHTWPEPGWKYQDLQNTIKISLGFWGSISEIPQQ